MKKATFLHLRLPFSFLLLPIFLFAWAIEPNVSAFHFISCLFIIHFLLYPASNVYNSYFDKDEKSIGGLKIPPKVSKEMYTYALLFDLVAVVLGFFLINPTFAAMLVVYGLASKAYSHPHVRLKKYPWISWFIAGFFQGYFTFLMSYVGLHDRGLQATFSMPIQLAALLSSLMLWGSYPMTQVYQHEEDAQRGDQTLSLQLGVLGTFHFVALAFAAATIAYVIYFKSYFSISIAYAYILFLLPVLSFFGYWYFRTCQSQKAASFKNTMRLNLLSALMLNAFYLFLGWWKLS